MKEWTLKIQNYYNISKKSTYFFDKSGEHINDLTNFWDDCIFVSKNFFFKGLSNINSQIFDSFESQRIKLIADLKDLNKEKEN